MYRYILIIAVSILLLHMMNNVYAADVIVSKTSECPILLRGKIVVGDYGRVLAAVDHAGLSEYWPEAVSGASHSICLDSTGGSFVEGLRIANHVRNLSIGTRVPSDARCYSACAVIFMAGRIKGEESDGVYRYLHVKGKLGFHAPYAEISEGKLYTSQDIEEFYDLANRTNSEFIKLANNRSVFSSFSIMQPSLIQELLATPREDILKIDTVEAVLRWQIRVYGYEMPNRSDNRQLLAQACENFLNWSSDRESKELPKDEVENSWRGVSQVEGEDVFYRVDFSGLADLFCDVRFEDNKGVGSGIIICTQNGFNGVNYGNCPAYGIYLSEIFSLPPRTPLLDIGQLE